MPAAARHKPRICAAVVLAVLAAALAASFAARPARAGSLSQLNSQLGATQGQEHSLSASVAALNGQLTALTRQISFVEAREAAVRAQLAADQTRLAEVRSAVVRERALVKLLKARLAAALTLLRAQLVSRYEDQPPSLITMLVDSHGFNQLLEQVDFLTRAQQEQQQIIAITTTAKHRAVTATTRLRALEQRVTVVTDEAAAESRALVGMNVLLDGRQQAVTHLRAARQAALNAARARGSQLRKAIARVQAQQAAAAAAAAAAMQSTGSYGGRALGPSGGWVIPYPIVLCESGGQDLPPNSAGASGYYQIIPSTWAGEGGTGPAAYLAPKSEQDAIAAKLWAGGAGWSNWVCAQILGIH